MVAAAVDAGTGASVRERGRRVVTKLAAGVLLVSTALSAAQSPERLVVTVSSGGFEPSSLIATKGESVVIEVRSSSGEHCFAIDARRVEKRVRPDRPAIVELTLTEAGRFPFYCCVETGRAAELERGELVVRE